MKGILVADIMTQEPLTIGPSLNLLECAKKMVKHKIGSFPIVEKKKLVGFITQKDILWAIIKKSAKDLKNINVIDVSRKKIATIRPNATMEEAFKKMKRKKFHKMPVIQNGELVGMITIRDILNFRPEFYPELEELSKIREESEKLKRVKKAKEIFTEGICEECGSVNWLYKSRGMIVCESCMNS